MRVHSVFGPSALIILSSVFLAGCQSAKAPTAADLAGPAPVDAAAKTADPAAAAAPVTMAAAPLAACTRPIAGPPAKPEKGADFAKNAVGKNIGRNVGRNLIAGLGGAVGGGLGQAVAGGVATEAIRTEQDLKGEWNATDGADTCGCTINVSSGVNLLGNDVNKGKLTNATCTHPALAAVAAWELGQTFTGYDAPLTIKDAKGAVVASLKRDGINYFSGTLADGRPVTLWRRSGADVE